MSPAEAHALAEHLEGADLRRTRAGVRNALADTGVAALAEDARLVSIASDALGAPAFAYKATLFDKSRRSNWLDAMVQSIPAVDCVVGRGGLAVMHPLLVHASSKAADERPRRVVHVEYTVTRELEGGLELAVVDREGTRPGTS